jgi:hypothetical protein
MKAVCGIIVLASLGVGLAGCSAPLVGIDPRLAPAQRERSQRDMPRPPLESHPSYETATATVDVPVPLARFSGWFAQAGATSLASFLTGTATVPGIVRTEALGESWARPGDRRRVVFADGNSAIEEILEIGTQGFRYEIWNLTSDTGRFITYALGDIALSELPSGTRIVWTTAFAPKAQPPDGWFIRSYVRDEFGPFMQMGLDAMGRRAVADLAPAVR